MILSFIAALSNLPKYESFSYLYPLFWRWRFPLASLDPRVLKVYRVVPLRKWLVIIDAAQLAEIDVIFFAFVIVGEAIGFLLYLGEVSHIWFDLIRS